VLFHDELERIAHSVTGPRTTTPPGGRAARPDVAASAGGPGGRSSGKAASAAEGSRCSRLAPGALRLR
jgi:hypothetical protein